MTLPTLISCSDVSLLSQVKGLRGTESRTLADIVLHLSEIDTRGIYRDAGYSSLFVYCTRELGYSEASAHRRIEAARALKDSPEIYELLRDGKITLCAIGSPLFAELHLSAPEQPLVEWLSTNHSGIFAKRGEQPPTAPYLHTKPNTATFCLEIASRQ